MLPSPRPSSSRSSPPRSPGFLRDAKVLLLQRRTDDAVAVLRCGIEQVSGCVEARLLLARTLVATGELRRSTHELSRLLALSPDAGAAALLCRVHLALEEPTRALEVARSYRARFPGHAELEALSAEAEALCSGDGGLDDTTEREEAEDPENGALGRSDGADRRPTLRAVLTTSPPSETREESIPFLDIEPEELRTGSQSLVDIEISFQETKASAAAAGLGDL